MINGTPLGKADCGFWVDVCLRRLAVPKSMLKEGDNSLTLSCKYHELLPGLESLFLLGPFGVRVTGTDCVLTPRPQTLAYGDWTGQGLPFYSGPLTYRYRIQGGERLRLRLGRFSAPCVTAQLDGKRIANLSLSPSEADLGFLEEGEHILDITVWPSRINSFGTFHLNDETVTWFGPDAWRSRGMRWTRTYRLTPTGLLSEPHLIAY